MRRWHKDSIDGLNEHIATRSYRAYLCDCLGEVNPTEVELGYINKYFDDSFKLWGEAAFQYMLFHHGLFESRLGIKAVTLKTERFETDDIVVHAYSDGGVIVVTSGFVDFQRQGVGADWWQIEHTRWP